MSEPIALPMFRCPGCNVPLAGRPTQDGRLLLAPDGQLVYPPLCAECFYSLDVVEEGEQFIQNVVENWLKMDAILREQKANAIT